MALTLDMCMALCARASAHRQWPEIGFIDQPAGLLAQLLGISLTQRLSPLDERRVIQRSQWFDVCCRDFFRRYPQAMCIELGAGLSTRFHRLCNSSDWPRFQWVDVDLPQITQVKADVLPPTDNYRLVAADILHDDWLSLSGWAPGQPLLILLEAVTSALEGDGILRLIDRLRLQAKGAEALELVLDDKHPHSWFAFCQTVAMRFGAPFRLPITRCIASLEYRDLEVVRQKSLLGNSALGLVINYKNIHEEYPCTHRR